MDKKRKAKIKKLIDQLTPFETVLEIVNNELSDIVDEETDVNSNLEEYFPNGENYEKSCAALDALNDATDNMSEVVSQLSDLIGNLETASE